MSSSRAHRPCSMSLQAPPDHSSRLRAMRTSVAVPAALSVSETVLAQEFLADEDAARREAAGEIWSMLFLLALGALAIHLTLRTRRPGQLPDAARRLAFLASTYLAAFFFLTSVSGIARFLRLFGLERETSSLIAIPLGLVAAYKIYSAYEKWRIHK